MAQVVRICTCSCGHMSPQLVDERPSCHVCNSDDVDWLNVGRKDFEMDLEYATEWLASLPEEENEDTEES